jgi:hypothetical protein
MGERMREQRRDFELKIGALESKIGALANEHESLRLALENLRLKGAGKAQTGRGRDGGNAALIRKFKRHLARRPRRSAESPSPNWDGDIQQIFYTSAEIRGS